MLLPANSRLLGHNSLHEQGSVDKVENSMVKSSPPPIWRYTTLKIGVPAYFRCFDFCLRQKTYNTQILFGPKNKAYVQFH